MLCSGRRLLVIALSLAAVSLTQIRLTALFGPPAFLPHSNSKRPAVMVDREPIVLLGTAGGRPMTWRHSMIQPGKAKLRHSAVSYVADCPHKCGFTFDWRKYYESAQLVIIPVFYAHQQRLLHKLSVEA